MKLTTVIIGGDMADCRDFISTAQLGDRRFVFVTPQSNLKVEGLRFDEVHCTPHAQRWLDTFNMVRRNGIKLQAVWL